MLREKQRHDDKRREPSSSPGSPPSVRHFTESGRGGGREKSPSGGGGGSAATGKSQEKNKRNGSVDKSRSSGPLPWQMDSEKIVPSGIESALAPLNGIVVTFTGLSRDKRHELIGLLRKMGAQVSASMDSKVTHLIAEKCEPKSEKYKEALRRQLPVLLPSWIYAANSVDDDLAGTLSAVTSEEIIGTYKTPLFAGCEITVSGFPGADRVDIGRLVELHGGMFTGQMSRSSCTHLIAATNSGEKFHRAHEWGTVCVVTSRWLRKCIEAGYRLPESCFGFPKAEDEQRRQLSLGCSSLSLSFNQKTEDGGRKENMIPVSKKMCASYPVGYPHIYASDICGYFFINIFNIIFGHLYVLICAASQMVICAPTFTPLDYTNSYFKNT